MWISNLLSRKKLLEWILLAGILSFACLICYRAGERGFFAFDQSILFDGSYRVSKGQIPFRDFVIPFGPISLWLQGVFFLIFGVSYANYILSAALINLLAVAISYRILKILFPNQTIPAILGSLLTAVWFYPPSGTPWMEQTAFFFGLVSLLSMLTALKQNQDPRLKSVLLLFSGVNAFVAFISKQNAGALWLFVPGILLLIGFQNRRKFIKNTGWFFSGWFTGLLVFAIWLWFYADARLFYRHFLVIPLIETGINRLPESLITGFHSIFVASGSGVVPALLTIIFATSLLYLLAKGWTVPFHKWIEHGQHLSLILILGLYLYQNLFQMTTNNQPENAIPFVGIITASAWGLLSESLFENSSHTDFWKFSPIKVLIIGGLTILMGTAFLQGIQVSMSRQLHGFYTDTTFEHHLAVDKLMAIRWGEPTLTRPGTPISAAQVTQLADILKYRGENFFIFPDFTVLYGALDVPSPQPLLWFHRRVTYPKKNNSYLDSWITADLEKNRVNIIVLEAESWYADRLADFPQLKAFIKENFIFEQEIGIFLIYVRKSPYTEFH